MKFLFTVLVSQTPVNATQKQKFSFPGLPKLGDLIGGIKKEIYNGIEQGIASGVKDEDQKKQVMGKIKDQLGEPLDEHLDPLTEDDYSADEVGGDDLLSHFVSEEILGNHIDYGNGDGSTELDDNYRGPGSDDNYRDPDIGSESDDNYRGSGSDDNYRGPGLHVEQIHCDSQSHQWCDGRCIDKDLPCDGECYCNNGRPKTGEDCEDPGERCQACDTGFGLRGDQCIQIYPNDEVHECQCTNGRGNSKSDCPSTEDCLDCGTGFIPTQNPDFPEYTICEKIDICVCHNGYAVTGENCAYAGYHSCDGCFMGYKLVDERCVNEKQGQLYCLPGHRFLDGKCVSCEDPQSDCQSKKHQCAYSLMVRREMCCVTCEYREPIPLYESNELDTAPPYVCGCPQNGLCWKSRTYDESCVQKIGGCEDFSLTEANGKQSKYTCEDLKYAGFCGQKYHHQEYMLKNCPRTCGYCQDLPNEGLSPTTPYGQGVQFRPDPDDLFSCAVKLPDNAEPFERQETCTKVINGGTWCTPMCKHGFTLVGSIRCNHTGDIKNDAQCVAVSGSDAEVLRVTEGVLTAFLRRDFANTLKRYFQETAVFSVHNMKKDCYPSMVYETIAQKVGFLNKLFPEGEDGRASDELIILGEDVLSRSGNFINVKVDTVKFRRTKSYQDDMKEIQPDIMILKNIRIVFQKNGSGLESEWSMAQFHLTVPCIHVAADIYDSHNLIREGGCCYSTLEGRLQVCDEGLQCGEPFDDDINNDFDVLTCVPKTVNLPAECENTPPANTVYGTDHNAKCTQLYQRGMCYGTYNAYMRLHCARTCDFCGSNAVQKSEDEYMADSEIADVPDKCQLEKSEGLGFYATKKWYYEPLEGVCLEFTYSGSVGNDNNFESEELCLTECSPNEKYHTTALGNLAYGEAKNEYPNANYLAGGPAKVGEYCTNINWPNDVTRECEPGSSCEVPENEEAAPDGLICRRTGACSLPKEPGDCEYANTDDEESMHRVYYFDSNTQTCKKFNWCGGTKNDNNFITEDLCLDACCPDGQKCTTSVCEAGFYFDPSTNSCRKNVCLCKFGSRNANDYCPQQGQNDCSECMKGYHLVGRTCIPNNCICPHGFTVSQDLCEEHIVNACASCITGFHLEVVPGTTCETCQPNICTCQNGTARNYEFCSTHGEEECEFCKHGYSLTRDKHCTAATCYSNADCACGKKKLQSCNTWFNVCEPEEALAFDLVLNQVDDAQVNTLLSVRCCNNDEPCRGVFPVTTHTGESRSICFEAHTYADAQIICEYYDMRLCSETEIKEPACLNDGCNNTGLGVNIAAPVVDTSRDYTTPKPWEPKVIPIRKVNSPIYPNEPPPAPPVSITFPPADAEPDSDPNPQPDPYPQPDLNLYPLAKELPSYDVHDLPFKELPSYEPPFQAIYEPSASQTNNGTWPSQTIYEPSASQTNNGTWPSQPSQTNYGPLGGPHLNQKEEDNTKIIKEKKEDELKEDKENIKLLNINSKKKTHMKFLQLSSQQIIAEKHKSKTRFWILSEETCIIGNNAPQNGTIGDCPRALARGESCKPACNAGFALTQPAEWKCDFANFGDTVPTLTGGGGCVPCDIIPISYRVMIGPYPRGHMKEEDCFKEDGCYDQSHSVASFGNGSNPGAPCPICFKRDGSIPPLSEYHEKTQKQIKNLAKNTWPKDYKIPPPNITNTNVNIFKASFNSMMKKLNLHYW